MSATRLMVMIFGIILIGGALTGMIASGFEYEVKDDRWTKPIETVTGFTIDIVKYITQIFTFIFDLVVGVFEGNALSVLGIGSGTGNNIITISGTGTHNGGTLDGKYIESETVSNKTREFIYNSTEGFLGRDRITVIFDDSGNIEDAQIRSNQFSLFEKEIYNSTSLNNSNEEFYENWQLTDTSLNLNPSATGSVSDININETIRGVTQEVQSFFGDVKNETKTSISYTSVIPEAIGYPIMIFFFIALIVGIIKLAPWT